jgi:hypothetical protein
VVVVKSLLYELLSIPLPDLGKKPKRLDHVLVGPIVSIKI